VLLNEIMLLKGSEQAVHRALGEPEAAGELAHAKASRPADERLEDANRSIDRLDHVLLPSRIVKRTKSPGSPKT
jgi:hypothetical protein